MIRAILIFFFFIYSSNSFGQDSVVVIVEIRSTTEDETVQNVSALIEIGSNSFRRFSNQKGVFSFKAKIGSGIRYKLTHTQFESTEEFKRISSKFKEDTINYVFNMNFIRTQNFDDIVIYPLEFLIPYSSLVDYTLQILRFKMMAI